MMSPMSENIDFEILSVADIQSVAGFAARRLAHCD
jgi:hypothetical protein